MNFKQKLADFVFGNRTTSQHPDIALTAMDEELDSESLVILAGMSEKDNSFELEQYFQQMLLELEIVLPSKIDAAYELLRYYANRIVNEPSEAYQQMINVNSINNAFPQPEPKEGEKRYVGEFFDLQYMFTWFRELQDFKDGSRLFYYNELSLSEQKKKFEEHLVEEAQNWLTHHENTHNIA